ncbi:MAG: DUF1080 domain-containing protein [Calditrichaeota bacterium]|nr:MAG: DUF1080 domain-containing protein [Calditrichota bacterium]
MRPQLIIVFLLSLVLFSCSQEKQDVQQTEPQLQPLFNGTDYTNWAEPENNVWWTISDGILAAKNDPEKQGSILWTEKNYRDFTIELDFKFGDGTVDSGVFLRTEHEQIQLGISGSLKRDMTCSPYISGKGYPVEAEGIKELLRLDDWNTVRIKAVGNQYTSWLNGKQVMQYTSETAVDEGPIGLQLHANREMSIAFRNIQFTELTAHKE